MEGAVVSMTVIILFLVFTTMVVGDVHEGLTVGSGEHNVSTQGLEALQTFGDFLVTITTIVVIVVILGFVFILARRSRGGA